MQVSVLTENSPVSAEKQTPKFEKYNPLLPLPGPCFWGFLLKDCSVLMGKRVFLHLLLNWSNQYSYEAPRRSEQHLSGPERQCGVRTSLQETEFTWGHLPHPRQNVDRSRKQNLVMPHSLVCGPQND